MIIVLILGNLLMLIMFALNIGRMPPQIPLFYSHPPGESQIAPWYLIFILPAIMNLIAAGNTQLARRIFRHNKFVTQTLRSITYVAIITLTAVFLKIILLIT